MEISTKNNVVFACLALLAAAAPVPPSARATLGESSASVTSDQHTLLAQTPTTVIHKSYLVKELDTSACSVREYLNSSGSVFAVAWRGVTPPDLSTLLGSYAGEYRTAKKLLPREHGRRASSVQTEHLVVETWGHMRDLQGRAYLPARLPEGVTENEIK